MSNRFFFITTFDSLSGAFLASILNKHPDIHCETSQVDPFCIDTSQEKLEDITIDKFIQNNTLKNKLFCGNAQQFSAFKLQHKNLIEKAAIPHKKVNIAIAPKLRVELLLHSWLKSNVDPNQILHHIEQTIKNNTLILYNFEYFYAHVLKTAISQKINIKNPLNKLFLIALTKVITFDTADLPSPSRTYCLEKMISNKEIFIEFMQYLTSNQIKIEEEFKLELSQSLDASFFLKLSEKKWEDWQLKLLDYYVNTKLRTIYYPHLDKQIAYFYSELGYKFFAGTAPTPLYTKLISIQLNSNRPSQLATYFDNIEETADEPSQIEVLVNIDDTDKAMETLLIEEIKQRQFTIKYIKTPKPHSFCDLWKPINELLTITDPQSYFLLNISDEMLFTNKGWDTLLKKYVGFFPDHLFRLRASRNKFRNYFDRWECSFAQDSIPITTKKWVDIGGNWNPCFGPDSYQQLIAFYLAREGMFSNEHFLRDIPVLDIKFHHDVPALGIENKKAWKHNSNHLYAMQICQSYKMQLEARRRAILIKANIIAQANQFVNFDIVDRKSKKAIYLINKTNHQVILKMNYGLSWLGITLTNQYRKLFFFSYFGDGKDNRKNVLFSFLRYLRAKYYSIHLLITFFMTALKKPNPISLIKQFVTLIGLKPILKKYLLKKA